jgi:hypothetical protein
VLDDKRPEVRTATADAPLLTDVIGPAAKAHHEAVRTHLTDLGVAVRRRPALVRGSTTTGARPSSSSTRCSARSRRSAPAAATTGLSQAIDGPPLPGIGWALGVDRTLLALEAEGVLPEAPPAVAGVLRAARRGRQGPLGAPGRRAAPCRRRGRPRLRRPRHEGRHEGRRPLGAPRTPSSSATATSRPARPSSRTCASTRRSPYPLDALVRRLLEEHA